MAPVERPWPCDDGVIWVEINGVDVSVPVDADAVVTALDVNSVGAELGLVLKVVSEVVDTPDVPGAVPVIEAILLSVAPTVDDRLSRDGISPGCSTGIPRSFARAKLEALPS